MLVAKFQASSVVIYIYSSRVSNLVKIFFPPRSLHCIAGITEVQPVIPLLLNTAINLARPIPSVQEYPSNPPPIPPPPEKYYASTEICKVSIKEKEKKCRPNMRSMTIGRVIGY